MAVSGSVDFSIDRDTMIGDAMREFGAVEIGKTPTAGELTHASRVLNAMLKAWQTYGLNLFTVKKQSITLVASKQSYTLGRSSADVDMDRPLQVLEAYRRDSNNVDTPMEVLSRTRYFELSDKDETGIPLHVYYDPQLTNGVLYVWPTADSSAASEYTLELLHTKPVDDMDSATDDFYFPQEWYEAIRLGLAYRLTGPMGAPDSEKRRLRMDAGNALAEVLAWDSEKTTIRFEPDAN